MRRRRNGSAELRLSGLRGTPVLIAALALALVACGARGDRAPAWPERTDPEVDGGESLAPRTSSVVAATESPDKDKDSKPADKDVKPDAAAEKTDDAKPAEKAATGTTTTTTPEDVIIIDDIVIEIEE